MVERAGGKCPRRPSRSDRPPRSSAAALALAEQRRSAASSRVSTQLETAMPSPRYSTHSWSSVVDAFRGLGQQAPDLAPLGEAVARLAASRYAAGLHPVQSMHTLRLFQHDVAGPDDEELRLDYEDGQFVVRYRRGADPDPRLSIAPPARMWTKRGADAIAMLERAVHHLGWFVEYRAASRTAPRR